MLNSAEWVFVGFGSTPFLHHFTESCLPADAEGKRLLRTWWFDTANDRDLHLASRREAGIEVWLRDGDLLAVYGPFRNECLALSYMGLYEVGNGRTKWSVFYHDLHAVSESTECNGCFLFWINPPETALSE